MFVAYVVYNLDDGNDLDIVGCSNTVQSAVSILNKRAQKEEDTVIQWTGSDGSWNYSELNAQRYSQDMTRMYGYQNVPYIQAK